MFFHADIKGDDLPRGALCLTYDDGPGATNGDGPGPRTAELADYLADRGVAATFFVIGRHAERHREVLARLRDGGHLIGNHTYSHPGLVSLALSGGDVIGEVARTDEIIDPYVDSHVRLFRAPYGNWRETDPLAGGADRSTSIVADLLNRDARLKAYVGPINWDISGEDYDFWRRGLSAGDCAAAYLDRIREAGRGIILMHDSSEDEEIRAGSRTYQATKLIVPALQEDGYRFVRIDAIPQVVSAVAASQLAAAKSRLRLSVTARGEKDGLED
jgi:peptidoglycan/xylan/chitin deacetylase (PgdA/CDA1 family)